MGYMGTMEQWAAEDSLCDVKSCWPLCCVGVRLPRCNWQVQLLPNKLLSDTTKTVTAVPQGVQLKNNHQLSLYVHLGLRCKYESLLCSEWGLLWSRVGRLLTLQSFELLE